MLKNFSFKNVLKFCVKNISVDKYKKNVLKNTKICVKKLVLKNTKNLC